MKTKTIIVETREAPEYEFSDMDSHGNILLMWMCPIKQVINANGETINEIIDNLTTRYFEKKLELLGEMAIALLRNNVGGDIDSSGLPAIHDNLPDLRIDGFNNIFLIGHLSEPSGQYEPGIYAFMYDVYDYDILNSMKDDTIKQQIKNAFAGALNYAVEPYL